MSIHTIRGRSYVFGDNINTDLISPAQYMELDNAGIAAHAMEGADATFPKRFCSGGIVVAGKNFGSGSSRETAPIALKGIGVSVVIAQFFARIFYRNSINIGLPVLICPQAADICEGDELEVEFLSGEIRNLTQKTVYRADPLPSNIMELVNAGGLMEYIKNCKGETE